MTVQETISVLLCVRAYNNVTLDKGRCGEDGGAHRPPPPSSPPEELPSAAGLAHGNIFTTLFVKLVSGTFTQKARRDVLYLLI